MATDQGNHHAEHHRLRHRQRKVGHLHRGRQGRKKITRADAHHQVGGQHASKQRRDGRPDADQRHGDGHRQRTRQHQAKTLGDTHHAHCVELFGYAHHTNLRGDRRAGAPGNQDGRQHRTEFAYEGDAQHVDDEGIGTEFAQLLRHQIREHYTDQEPDQRCDGQGRRADPVQMPRDVAPWAIFRRTHQSSHVDQQLADQTDQIARMVNHLVDTFTQAEKTLPEAAPLGTRWADRITRHPLQHGTLRRQRQQLGWPGAPPGVPQQLRAGVIEPIESAQVPVPGLTQFGNKCGQLAAQHIPDRGLRHSCCRPTPSQGDRPVIGAMNGRATLVP